MREPRIVGRVTGTDSHVFCFYRDNIFYLKEGGPFKTHKILHMMKNVLLLVVLALFSLSTYAARESVLVKPFTHSTSVSQTYCNSVRNKVMEGINNKGRVKVLDSATEADYTLDGQVVSITYTTGRNDKGTTYSAKINYQLKVTRISDNEIIANKTFEATSSTLFSTFYTKLDAVNSAVDFIDAQIPDFVDEVFKSYGTVIEVAEVKKDAAKKVYISLGSEDGILKGQKLDVRVEKTIGGRTINKVIGEIKVESVEGADISLCKVTKEGKEIQKAMLETPDAVTVVTKVNTNIFGL